MQKERIIENAKKNLNEVDTSKPILISRTLNMLEIGVGDEVKVNLSKSVVMRNHCSIIIQSPWHLVDENLNIICGSYEMIIDENGNYIDEYERKTTLFDIIISKLPKIIIDTPHYYYHVIFFGLPYIKKSELQEIWNKGFVKINAIEKFERLGQYLVKYMTKDIATGRDEEQKRYLASRGMKKSTEIHNIDIEQMIQDEQLQLIYTSIHKEI